MSNRAVSLALVLCLAGGLARGAELQAELFAETPTPAAGEMLTPTALAADAAANRLYVLDAGLGRIAAFTADGAEVDNWSLAAMGIAWRLPAGVDPLLPLRVPVAGGKALYFLDVDRAARQITLTALDGPATSRVIPLPENAANAAAVLDGEGRVLAAYLRVDKGKAYLVLAREEPTGTLDMLGMLENPCDGQVWNLSVTGMAAAADGRFAVGIGQTGATGYAFVRSWLIQGALRKGQVTEQPSATHRFSLLDQRGRVLERFRACVEMAGQRGYQVKSCAPLFTALAFGADGTIISGGGPADPFLRVYEADGTLARSLPRQGTGGQHVASLPADGGVRLFAAAPADGRVEELAYDGRAVGGIGRPLPYDLSAPLSLAADGQHVYVAYQWHSRASRHPEGVDGWKGAFAVARFTAGGRFCWAQRVTPPAGLEDAQPVLAAPGSERVLLGWRQPGAAGLGWVETLQEDGSPGLPVWPEPCARVGPGDPATQPAPLLVGDNGSVYLMRETKTGAALQSFSSTGAFMQQFPPEVQGVTAVAADGSLAWAKADDQAMTITLYTPQGARRGWKRVPRPAQRAALLPARADALWGWLTSTRSLLRLDETMTVVDEATVLDYDGSRIGELRAIAGDRASRIYLAAPGRILVIRRE